MSETRTLYGNPPWSLHLEIPLPPSKNELHLNAKRWTHDKKTGEKRSYMGRRCTPAYDEFKRAVWALVMAQTTPEQRDRLIGKHLLVWFYVRFPDDWRDHDASNIIDAGADALKVPLGVDDDNFWVIGATRHEYKPSPLCRVVIMEAPTGPPL